ncbi:MAG: SemiSWEET family transporter [Acidobacteriota bacterium]
MTNTSGARAFNTPHKVMDKLIYLIAALGPLSSLPQIIEIWFVDKSAVGVSFSTWLLFLLMSVAWLIYGIMQRDRPLIISNALWIVTDAIVIAGAYYYDNDLL